MACFCTCGRTIDCGETVCGLCSAEPDSNSTLSTQNSTMKFNGMKEDDYTPYDKGDES